MKSISINSNLLFRFLFLFYYTIVDSNVKFFCKLLCTNKLEKRFRMICLMSVIHGDWYFFIVILCGYLLNISYYIVGSMVVSLCCRTYCVDQVFTLDIEHFSLATEINKTYHVVMSSIQTIRKEFLH